MFIAVNIMLNIHQKLILLILLWNKCDLGFDFRHLLVFHVREKIQGTVHAKLPSATEPYCQLGVSILGSNIRGNLSGAHV